MLYQFAAYLNVYVSSKFVATKCSFYINLVKLYAF